jgi:hypothetical protein
VVLGNDVELCGGFCVRLTKERMEWLSERYVNCNWDVDELEGMSEEIVDGEKLKLTRKVRLFRTVLETLNIEALEYWKLLYQNLFLSFFTTRYNLSKSTYSTPEATQRNYSYLKAPHAPPSSK